MILMWCAVFVLMPLILLDNSHRNCEASLNIESGGKFIAQTFESFVLKINLNHAAINDCQSFIMSCVSVEKNGHL